MTDMLKDEHIYLENEVNCSRPREYALEWKFFLILYSNTFWFLTLDQWFLS